jgi:hypothetical protein
LDITHYLPDHNGNETAATNALGKEMTQLILDDDDPGSDLNSEDEPEPRTRTRIYDKPRDDSCKGPSRKKLQDFLTEDGVICPSRSTGERSFVLTLLIFREFSITCSFTLPPEIRLQDEWKIAAKFDLAEPGCLHDNCLLANLASMLRSEDPCIRLAVKCRILGAGRKIIRDWFTLAPLYRTGNREKAIKRIFKYNTLVDLVEGKTPLDLIGIERRLLGSWNVGEEN